MEGNIGRQHEEWLGLISGLSALRSPGGPWCCAFPLEHRRKRMAEAIHRYHHLRGSAVRDKPGVDAHARTRCPSARSIPDGLISLWCELPFPDRRYRQRTGTVPFCVESSVPSHGHTARNDRSRGSELVHPQVARGCAERKGASMRIEIGHIEGIFQYPVKSMAGERLEAANLGWYGLEGDRRLAFRRMDDRSGMPWLTAGRLPDLLLFTPLRREGGAPGDLPTHVRAPNGEKMPVFSEDLGNEIGRRFGSPVQMMQLRHGIFDEACISVIASDTVREIGRLAGRTLDLRRFRPNVVVRLVRSSAFQEDEWLGGELSFGDGNDAPAIAVTMRDERCGMVNLDPDSASSAPEVMKAVVRANQNNAGIYGAVTRTGRLRVGQSIFLSVTTGEGA